MSAEIPDVDPLGSALSRFMSLYGVARTQRYSHGHDAVGYIAEAARLIEGLIAPDLRRAGARVEWSVGRGNWASVPWIAVLGAGGTRSTQDGVYPVLLFHEDLNSVEVTIAQGVTKPRRDLGRRAAVLELHRRADRLRPELQGLEPYGFHLDNDFDLGRSSLGRDYVESTIVHRQYTAGELPFSTISQDLAALLEAYSWIATDPGRDADTTDGAHALVVYGVAPETVDAVPPPGHRGWWSWDQTSEEFGALRPGDLLVFVIDNPELLPLRLRTGNHVLRDVTVGRLLGPVERTDAAQGGPGQGDLRPWGVQYETLARVREVSFNDAFSDRAANALLNAVGYLDRGAVVPVAGSPFLESYMSAEVLPPSPRNVADASTAFVRAVIDSGVLVEEDDVRAFLAALATKPFAILTGLSGSGKTQLALRLGEWFGTDPHGRHRMQVVPIRPDWTGPEYLFGYEDTLRSDTEAKVWAVPDALEFIYQALDEPDAPYLLVLDEMNLAHVERYFADYLSGLESEYPVLPQLDRDGQRWVAVGNSQRLPLPRNLVVVGTVNVDETTYLFSPKVLDRAFTFEFRTTTDQLDPDAAKPRHIAPASRADLATFSALLRDDQWHRSNRPAVYDDLVDELRSLHSALSASNHEFGHRVMYEAMRYAAVLNAAGITELTLILDRIVLTKILPKIHGTRARVQPTLEALREFADGAAPDAPRLPHSADKLARMWKTLLEAQFVSFTE